MVTLSVVVLATFAIIYAVTYSNTIDEIEKKVQRVPEFFPRSAAAFTSDGSSVETDSSANNNAASSSATNTDTQGSNVLPADFSPSIILFLKSDGELNSVKTYLDLGFAEHQEVLELVRQTGGNSGQISYAERRWQFAFAVSDPFEIPIQGILAANPMDFMRSGTMQVNLVDITESTDQLTRLLIMLIIASIVILTILFFVSLYLANRSIKPIEETWSKQRQFVTDASHELKTPIAIIGANLDAMASDSEASVGSQKKWMDYAHHELDRMGKLINDLLYLAQSEDGKSECLDFDLSKLIKDTATSMEAILYEKNIRFTQNIQESVIINADESKITQALVILLDNAAKYTDQDGWIEISATKDKGWVKVSVKNSGEGISLEDLPNIFDRFYRVDKSRSTKSGGYGLGLSIFRAIIERSGGKVGVSSENNVTEFNFIIRSEK